MADQTVDLLAFGAHPDDVEIMAGGTLVKMKKIGYRTGIIDMTRGESGTYGTVEERNRESEEAARILGLDVRANLDLPDGDLRNTPENRLKVIEAIRRFRPEVVMAPVMHTRHPDHANAGILVKEAAFLAGLEKIQTGQAKHRPSAVIHFGELNKDTPDFAVDITDEWETKLAAIRAHQSQVFDPSKEEEPAVKTLIKSRQFWEIVEAKSRYYGGVTGVTYAEVFFFEGIPRMDDVVKPFMRNIK